MTPHSSRSAQGDPEPQDTSQLPAQEESAGDSNDPGTTTSTDSADTDTTSRPDAILATDEVSESTRPAEPTVTPDAATLDSDVSTSADAESTEPEDASTTEEEESDQQDHPDPSADNERPRVGVYTVLAWIFAIIYWPMGIAVSLIARYKSQSSKPPLVASVVMGVITTTALVTFLLVPTSPSTQQITAHLTTDAQLINTTAHTLAAGTGHMVWAPDPTNRSPSGHNTYINSAATALYGAHPTVTIQAKHPGSRQFTLTDGSVSVCLTATNAQTPTAQVHPSKC